jgi:GTPase SAR1 family protein
MYTRELLKQQYALHKAYVRGRIETTKKIGVKVRLPCVPEDISENIVKQILHTKLKDTTSRWNCNKGDLFSEKEGVQECKCFTSDGPLSFTPTSEWNVIYFLDTRNWLDDVFVLHRIPLQRNSPEWQNIKVSKTQTFEDQCKQGRRPRITWESLHPQISQHCVKVYEGNFEDIFIPSSTTEQSSEQSTEQPEQTPHSQQVCTDLNHSELAVCTSMETPES